jgi:hypothetical protein
MHCGIMEGKSKGSQALPQGDRERQPVLKGKNRDKEKGKEKEDSEARKLFTFLAESRNAKLGPRDWHEELPHHDLTGSDKAGEEDTPSIFIPGPGEAGLAQPSASRWVDVRSAFTQRLLIYRGGARSNGKGMDGGSLPQPGVPGRNNWIPLGPSAIRKGQATGNPPVSGRALRLAIAPGGNRVYVATADGGVWRSDNAGTTWKSTMDAFDLDPTEFASTSNACGAIAIDLADPDRVYVGTGEGDTFLLFDSRTISALPSYHGVGPVVSNDGGQSWIRMWSALQMLGSIVGSQMVREATTGFRSGVVFTHLCSHAETERQLHSMRHKMEEASSPQLTGETHGHLSDRFPQEQSGASRWLLVLRILAFSTHLLRPVQASSSSAEMDQPCG